MEDKEIFSTPIKHKKLNELEATAISGNDISSSVLYVSALAIAFAGKYAWITLLIVAFVLYLFRKIYGEVVGALPLNGGAYNALLNTTSKKMASWAATFTLLSYMATAVISANEAVHYLTTLFHHKVDQINHAIYQMLGMPPDSDINFVVLMGTSLLLALFAGLAIMGIKESSKVAIGIFLFHLTSMIILILAVSFYIYRHGWDTFKINWHTEPENGIWMAIFFGFAASMLGISGFESSANFVEEQERGVFPKTLRNMWIVVSILNPLMAFLALAVLRIDDVKLHYKETLLSTMAELSAGEWLAFIISIDAFLVLSGAVLTSYIGVTGLLERMTLDRIMPNYFLKKNSRGASYRIIIFFLLLNLSILWLTRGNVKTLAGVYTISFLSVMFLFALGNILLKIKRKHLPAPERAPWLGVFTAMTAVLVALIGNIIMPAEEGQLPNWEVFLFYFIPAMVFIIIMLNRTLLLKLTLSLLQTIFEPIRAFFIKMNRRIERLIDEINSQEFVFFTKGKSIANLNKAMLYIRDNEHTKKVKIVKVLEPGEKVPEKLLEYIHFLDEEYPEIDIEFVPIEGKFGPELIKELSKKWKIPINFMFIGSPDEKFPYRLEELGGVRLIM
ncbi:MAG: APC family permease [Chlorobi bacterium]|nr:APC family permease [Chlorobiota bacterium]